VKTASTKFQISAPVQQLNEEVGMKNEETILQHIRASRYFFIHPSSFFIPRRRCRRM
jgi:hypothetical protein